MTKHRIYTMSFACVYPHYVTKAERKGRCCVAESHRRSQPGQVRTSPR